MLPDVGDDGARPAADVLPPGHVRAPGAQEGQAAKLRQEHAHRGGAQVGSFEHILHFKLCGKKGWKLEHVGNLFVANLLS